MNKLSLVLFVIVCILLFGFLFVSTNTSRNENMNRQFHGIVESVRYDKKAIPYVKVNGKEYYLDAGYNFKRKIEKADSISKQKGSNVYKLRKASGEIVVFRN